MSRDLEIARSFGTEILKEIDRYRKVDLNDSMKAAYFLATVFPELEKRICLMEQNIEAARLAGRLDLRLDRQLHTRVPGRSGVQRRQPGHRPRPHPPHAGR